MVIARVLALVIFISTIAPAQPAAISIAEYAERRSNLASKLEDGALLALGSAAPDHDYLPFYQNSPFLYLTGVQEPNAAMVIVKRDGAIVAATMFTDPKIPAQEVWSGERLGADGVKQLTNLPWRARGELRPYLDSILRKGITTLHVVGDYSEQRDVLSAHDQFVAHLRKDFSRVTVQNANPTLDIIRGRKSPAELALLRKSIEITVEAHKRAMAEGVRPDGYEYEAQALIEYVFRWNGADRPSFASIIGSGPNSTTLHYNRSDRQMKAGEVIVMDIGSSYRGYAADITRTVPVSGVFTREMRDVYQIVRDAQAAAERNAVLGALWSAVSDSASATIAAGLARIGLIEGPTATYDCGTAAQASVCPQYKLFFMHGLGHGIGLDVHDPEQFYYTGRIEPGSAFTIEPGIYVRADVLDVIPDTPRNRALRAKLSSMVAKYRNIGVRIEDDYLVTEDGVEWVSKAPREIDEIESLMRRRYAQ